MPLVGLLHGGPQQFGAHRPSVDEKLLHGPVGPGEGGLCDKPRHLHLPGAPVEGEQLFGKGAAVDGVEHRHHVAVSRGIQPFFSVFDEFQGQPGMGQGHLFRRLLHIGSFGGVLFEELHPGGGVEKQVFDHNGGAVGAAGLLLLCDLAPCEGQMQPQGSLPGLGEQIHPGHRSDGRQGLPPEAQGVDAFQIPLPFYLAGGMAEESGGGVLRLHAAAVVGDPDIGDAALADLHRHSIGPGVQSVFQQLLHHRRRTLHHLPGGDHVGHLGSQNGNFTHFLSTPWQVYTVRTKVPALRWG